MPPIRHSSKRKPPPDGFSDLEDQLLIFQNKMKDAQNKPPPTGPKHQAQWEIFQISHQRSRYIYDLYYEKEAISKQLYDWLLKNGYADAMLIAKWKKQGYEKVSPGNLMITLDLALTRNPALLPPLCPDEGDQLQLDLRLSRAEGDPQRRPGGSVCQLRVPRMRLKRLGATLR
ncbi:Pre-mRNA-splicing factor cwf14 [Verticillium dahliae]